MKAFLKSLLLLITVTTVSAQDLFDTFRNEQAVNYLSINPMMFKLLGQINIETEDEETAAYIKMIQSITSFKVLMTSDNDLSASLEKRQKKWIKEEGFDLLMQLNEDENQLWFYAVAGENENIVKRLAMFVKSDELEDSISIQGSPVESVFLLMEGKIDLELIGKLTESMDLPGGTQLSKVQKIKT